MVKRSGIQNLQYLVILIGIILRLDHFFEFRSFWFDEAQDAFTVMQRSFSEILVSKTVILAFIKTPPLFSLATKILFNLFGNYEWVFRLIPQVCGIASLFLFKSIMSRYARPVIVLIALTFFSLSNELIYFSAEFKSYSSDVFVILLFFWAFKFIEDSSDVIRIWMFSVAAAIGIWFSFPLVFLFGAVGAYLTGRYAFQKQ